MGELDQLIEELTGGDDSLAEAAAGKIAAYESRAVEPLRRLLDSSDPDTRWWAVRTLSEIQDNEIPGLLIRSLDDPAVSVCEAAALGLTRQPHPSAIHALIRLLDSQSSLLARLSGSALVKIGSEAVPSLVNVLENGAQRAKLEAVRALAQIGDKSSIPALFEALQKDSMLMEYWASEGLDNMGVGMDFFKT